MGKNRTKALARYIRDPIGLVLIPGEEFYLIVKLANGSAWLTNYCLIIGKHHTGHIARHKPEICT